MARGLIAVALVRQKEGQEVLDVAGAAISGKKEVSPQPLPHRPLAPPTTSSASGRAATGRAGRRGLASGMVHIESDQSDHGSLEVHEVVQEVLANPHPTLISRFSDSDDCAKKQSAPPPAPAPMPKPRQRRARQQVRPVGPVLRGGGEGSCGRMRCMMALKEL